MHPHQMCTVIRLIVWDPPMTHYVQIKRPNQLAAADFSVVRWLLK